MHGQLGRLLILLTLLVSFLFFEFFFTILRKRKILVDDSPCRRTTLSIFTLFYRASLTPQHPLYPWSHPTRSHPSPHHDLQNKLGRVHLGVQDLSKLHLRKRKALKKTSEEKKRQKMDAAASQQESESTSVDDGIQDMET